MTNPTKKFFYLIPVIALCMVACGSTEIPLTALDTESPTTPSAPEPTQEPTQKPTQKPPALATLESGEPDYIVTFDGKSCIVEGPAEVSPGEYLVVLYNQTDLPATLWVALYQSEGSYEDHLLWREENCGGQGTNCKDEDGREMSYNLIRWSNAKNQAQDGIKVYYKVYDLTIQREHVIWVSSDSWWGWLCAPFQVVTK
ncbi:MAG TPA: hypothetical protein ENF22_08340 [Chloroflexi bacterium]|nr:hypothetical protein [Chloroflexota bacterium]